LSYLVSFWEALPRESFGNARSSGRSFSPVPLGKINGDVTVFGNASYEASPWSLRSLQCWIVAAMQRLSLHWVCWFETCARCRRSAVFALLVLFAALGGGQGAENASMPDSVLHGENHYDLESSEYVKVMPDNVVAEGAWTGANFDVFLGPRPAGFFTKVFLLYGEERTESTENMHAKSLRAFAQMFRMQSGQPTGCLVLEVGHGKECCLKARGPWTRRRQRTWRFFVCMV